MRKYLESMLAEALGALYARQPRKALRLYRRVIAIAYQEMSHADLRDRAIHMIRANRL